VVQAYSAGQPERAHDIFDVYLSLARYEQQQGIGLACRKYVLAKRGVIRSAALRRPSSQLSRVDLADVERLLERQAKRLKEIGA
jgi:4-hydroxy-tetrahydrodipicolinate synthase